MRTKAMYVTPSVNLAVQLRMVYISNPLRITRRLKTRVLGGYWG